MALFKPLKMLFQSFKDRICTFRNILSCASVGKGCFALDASMRANAAFIHKKAALRGKTRLFLLSLANVSEIYHHHAWNSSLWGTNFGILHR